MAAEGEVWGAGLAYNAELSRRLEGDGQAPLSRDYGGALERWRGQVEGLADDYARWDREAMWAIVSAVNPRSLRSRARGSLMSPRAAAAAAARRVRRSLPLSFIISTRSSVSHDASKVRSRRRAGPAPGEPADPPPTKPAPVDEARQLLCRRPRVLADDALPVGTPRRSASIVANSNSRAR